MFPFKWNRCRDIGWTVNCGLFEFIAFNKQVIKFDHIIKVKLDCCMVYMNCVIKALKEILIIMKCLESAGRLLYC